MVGYCHARNGKLFCALLPLPVVYVFFIADISLPLLQLTSSSLPAYFQLTSELSSECISPPDSTHIAAVAQDCSVRLWDARHTQKCCACLWLGMPALALSWEPSSQPLLAVGELIKMLRKVCSWLVCLFVGAYKRCQWCGQPGPHRHAARY